MPRSQIVRSSLSAQIREHLMKQILSGALRPGDRLVELRIAAELNTSQAPVREAVRELEAMGLVETRHNKGARVRVISDDEIREIYDVRAQLEAYASECVAKAGIDLRSKLEKQMEQMRKAAHAADSFLFAQHNMRFHRIILEAAGNDTLLSVWEGLNVRSRTSLNVMRHSADLLRVTDSHQVLVDTLCSGDPEAARLAARDHVLVNKP
ncbi:MULTISPECIES: GntR family transcriptional regulator [unclassified Mameliella]|uniref:GntR family transcriptional regulator n=1 Tax=unclassified Mameliella TaxID=2630630 RepID=UPI00273E30D3|nr:MULTISPECIES: GntR family transcriptional regulator [unclassified Mameliella]